MVRLKMLGALAPLQIERDSDGYMSIPCGNQTLSELIAMTPLCETSIKYSALVNNRVANLESLVRDGDTVTIMPLMAGG